MKTLLFTTIKQLSQKLSGTGLGKIPFVMPLYKRLITTTSPKQITLGNIIYHLDDQDSLGLSIFGVNDETQVRLLKREIKKDWVVIDVGAHIGYYTMMYASLVGEKGKVYAFEPSKKTYKILLENIKANNFKNIVAENNAVSDKKKVLRFYESGNSLTNRVANATTAKQYTSIQAIRLDDYFKNSKAKIDFVKIDVEGAEYQVLQGMTSLLKTHKQIKLLIEFCPEHLAEYSVSAEDLLSFLEKLGFSFYDVSDKTKSIKSITKKKLIDMYATGITNIFCTRS